MLTKEYPDHHDATLILQLYDLRREGLMRESRAAVTRFKPQNAEEAVAKHGAEVFAAWTLIRGERTESMPSACRHSTLSS